LREKWLLWVAGNAIKAGRRGIAFGDVISYDDGMAKRKATITLTDSVLRDLDKLTGKGGNRSEIIEHAVVHYLAMHKRRQRDARDRRIIDDNAKALNIEAADVLDFQIEW